MFKVNDKSITIMLPSPEAYLERNIYDEPYFAVILNPLMPGGNKKVTHT